MDSAGTNFIKIKSSEMLTKLERLAADKGRFSVWNKGEQSVAYKVKEIRKVNTKNDTNFLISLFSEGATDTVYKGKSILLSFSILNVDYFGEGTFLAEDSQGAPSIQLASTIYRSEKRGNERLLTFPHYQVYAYFKIKEKNTELDNVINFSELKEKGFSEKNKFIRMSDTGTIQASQLSGAESDDVVGFRVLDLANNGISFLAKENEKDFFIKERVFESIFLGFDGETYTLKNGVLIYNIDYVGGKKLYKLGIKFDSDSDLTIKLTEALREDSSQNGKDDFENFVKE